jgi:hypothetical protein
MRHTPRIALASGVALAGVVAALVAGPVSAQVGGFNGVWTVHHSSGNCFHKTGTFKLRIANGKVSGRTGGRGIAGTVSSGGSIRWTTRAAYDGGPVHWTGRIGASAGSGSYWRADAKCGGTFSLQQG